VDVHLRRTLSDRYPTVDTNEEALELEGMAIDDLRAEGHCVFPKWAGTQPVMPEPVVEVEPVGSPKFGDFTARELEEERAIDAEPPGGEAESPGRATVYEVSGPDGVALHVGDISWPNGERSVQVIDRLQSPSRFDRLRHGLRLSVLRRGDLQYVELRQARMKDEHWSNLFVATREELAAGAGADVWSALMDVGAKAVGPREDILGGDERKRPGLCALFDDEGDLVPLCAYVLTRIAPIHRQLRA
jgi:hypothetical protein